MSDVHERLSTMEKRRLQELLLSDIERAVAEYKKARQEQREELKERLVAGAPPELIELAKQFAKAKKESEGIVKELAARGYALSGYPEETLRFTDADRQPELVAFDAKTSKAQKRIADLKRDFTLRLFADGEEPKALFSALTGELTEILS